MDRMGIEGYDREQFLCDAFLQIAITLEADARIVVDDGGQALDLCWDWQWTPGEPPLRAVTVPAGERPTRPFRLATTASRAGDGAPE
jgi:hypothetical protein